MSSIDDLATRFAALAEPTRLRLMLLCRGEQLLVGQCARSLNLPEPAVSRHLAVLAQAGLLVRERDGREVRYGWSPEARGAGWLELALAPVATADATVRRDAARLARLRTTGMAVPFVAEGAFGQRLAAALRQLAPNLSSARVLGIDLEQGSVLTALQSMAASMSLLARDARQRRAVAAFARGVSLEFDWADEQRPRAEFDVVCLAVRDAAQLPQRLAAAVSWLAPQGRLLVAVPYESLEQASGDAGPHPLFRLRAALGGQGLSSERLLPVEAAGEHWLLASGLQTASDVIAQERS